MSVVGKPVNRVDGPLKVCGEAKYAAEYGAKDLAHGFVISSAITKGKIIGIDDTKALRLPGVIKIITHKNRPDLAWFDSSYKDQDAPKGEHFRALYDEKILYNSQPVALVVAEDFETARAAAALVEIQYESESHQTDLAIAKDEAFVPGKEKSGFQPPPKPKGDSASAWKAAPFKIKAEYSSPTEHHNPMENHASTVVYDEGKYLIYDKTQGVANSKSYVCKVFGLSEKDVRVLSPFVGGAFGSGLRPQYQLYLAMMAAKDLKRSVKVSLTRQQMFTFGHRPRTLHEVALAADPNGHLLALEHKAIAETSSFENYVEVVVNWATLLYESPNTSQEYKIAKVDTYTPLDMRAPGAAWGVNVIEMAMDELAYELKMDPLALRLKNYTSKDENQDKPFTSKQLLACYDEGAKEFGWTERDPKPRSMRRGHKLIGYGMATGAWDAEQQKASAKVVLTSDGRAQVSSATSDIGTGTYTIMTQIAADTLGLSIENVRFELGDTEMPPAPLQGGSWTASSVGSAVEAVCLQVNQKVLDLLNKMKDSPFNKVKLEDVIFHQGKITLKSDRSKSIMISEVLKLSETEKIELVNSKLPNLLNVQKYSRKTHSAYFAQVEVDEETGEITVKKVLATVAAGKILNPKTARSQVMGGVIWGISMALHEESLMDHKLGKYMNHNLAEYHIPVNADIHDIDVKFIEEKDEVVNPLGVKGLGEIGIVGAAAAVANAIYHATGVRVREFPITLDKVLEGL